MTVKEKESTKGVLPQKGVMMSTFSRTTDLQRDNAWQNGELFILMGENYLFINCAVVLLT